MPILPKPMFRELDAPEAEGILSRNHVGRIAYSFHNRVDIEPISYVHAGGVIYMRTGPGSKLATLAHAPWVAFEVDEVDGPFDWRSVVAHGTVYVLEENGSPLQRASYRVALQHLRTLNPHTLGEDDPTPERTVVMQLRPDVAIGREARSPGACAENPPTVRACAKPGPHEV